MLSLSSLKKFKNIEVIVARRVESLCTALMVSHTLKKESMKHDIQFIESVDRVIEESSITVLRIYIDHPIGIKRSNILTLGGPHSTIENTFCLCGDTQPSPFVFYSFLKRNKALDGHNLWPILMFFSYERMFLGKSCDFCLGFREELIFEAGKLGIEYRNTISAPFYRTEPLMEVLLNNINFVSNNKIFRTRNPQVKLFEVLAQMGISIRIANEIYSNLEGKHKKHIENKLPKEDTFIKRSGFEMVSGVEGFFSCAHFLSINSPHECITSEEFTGGFKLIRDLMDIAIENINRLKTVGRYKILVMSKGDEEFFKMKLLCDFFTRFFQLRELGFKCVIVNQYTEDIKVVSNKIERRMSKIQFRDFLRSCRSDE